MLLACEPVQFAIHAALSSSSFATVKQSHVVCVCFDFEFMRAIKMHDDYDMAFRMLPNRTATRFLKSKQYKFLLQQMHSAPNKGKNLTQKSLNKNNEIKDYLLLMYLTGVPTTRNATHGANMACAVVVTFWSEMKKLKHKFRINSNYCSNITGNICMSRHASILAIIIQQYLIRELIRTIR